ncbi:MAG TPA: cytochrome c [Kofleriaceae bacterium]
MKRTALILILMAAACGGKKSEPAKPETGTTEQPVTTEPATPATPAEPAAPAEPAKPAEPDPAVVAAAALAEQYEAGKKVYTDKGCAKCHGDKGEGNKKNPAVMGEKALPEKAAKTAKLRKGVAFKTAADVLGFVKAKMPAGKEAGTLTDDEAAAVTAWILSENKVKVEKKLDATNAAAINLR